MNCPHLLGECLRTFVSDNEKDEVKFSKPADLRDSVDYLRILFPPSFFHLYKPGNIHLFMLDGNMGYCSIISGPTVSGNGIMQSETTRCTLRFVVINFKWIRANLREPVERCLGPGGPSNALH